MYWSRPRLVSTGASIAGRRRAVAAGRARQLGRGRSLGPLERLEDRGLGDPVAALEVRRLGVQRGDGRERVGQVVEDDDEVGLDERGHRDADRIALGQRHAGLEGGDRVVRQGADRPTGEPRHALDRQDPAARHERPDGLERVRGRGRLGRQVAVVGRDRDRAGLDVGQAVADLQQPARADPEERVPPQPFAALDRLEQVGGPPSSRRSRAPIGVSRSAARVARNRIVSAELARRCACARLSGSAVVIRMSP